jgi:integrase
LVTEKGSKTRSIAIPVPLAIMLLEFVWDQRHTFVCARQRTSPGYRPPDTLFVSMKSGRQFTPDAISNLLKQAFNQGGVRGSGHRLRAYYAEQVVYDAYLRAKAKHGRAFDVATILTVAAEALGHSDTKTLPKYLNRILRRDMLAEGFPIVARDPTAADNLRGLAAAIDDGVPGVAEALVRLLSEHSVAPIPAPELPGAPKPQRDRSGA